MLPIQFIPSFKDNYIWLYREGQQALVVDPGEAEPVLARLEAQNLTLSIILVTHYHNDHIGGITALKQRYPDCQIYAPHLAPQNFPEHIEVKEGDTLAFSDFETTWQVWETPGHTAEHVVYWNQSALFSGDMLFSGGCGRVFTGTLEQLSESLARLEQLPDNIMVYPAHEYTAQNLRFCYSIEPHNSALLARIQQVNKLEQQGCPSVPVPLITEKATNVFLRTSVLDLQQQVQQMTGELMQNRLQLVTFLRKKKDFF